MHLSPLELRQQRPNTFLSDFKCYEVLVDEINENGFNNINKDIIFILLERNFFGITEVLPVCKTETYLTVTNEKMISEDLLINTSIMPYISVKYSNERNVLVEFSTFIQENLAKEIKSQTNYI